MATANHGSPSWRVNRTSKFTDKLLTSLRWRREYGGFTDFTIKVGNASIPCHKVVLASACPYFDALFEAGMKEVEDETVTWDFFDEKDVKIIVEYLYSGNITLNWENVEGIVEMCEFLQLLDLKEECSQFIVKNVSASNCGSWYALAGTYNMEDVRAKAQKYIVKCAAKSPNKVTPEAPKHLLEPYINKIRELSDISYPNQANAIQLLDHLFIGNEQSAMNRGFTEDFRITHVINCSENDCRNTYSVAEGIKYLGFSASDDNKYDIMQHVDEVHDFIEEGRKKGKVLVHCMHRTSRSAVLVAAYIMKYWNVGPISAVKFLKDKRVTMRNANFQTQLVKFAWVNALLESDKWELQTQTNNNVRPAYKTEDDLVTSLFNSFKKFVDDM